MKMKQTNAASPKDIEFVEYYGFNECGWSGIAPAIIPTNTSSTAPMIIFQTRSYFICNICDDEGDYVMLKSNILMMMLRNALEYFSSNETGIYLL